MRLPKPLRYPLAIANDVRVESQHDNVVIVAAGVAFYAVLALLPALFVAVSLYGLFTDVGEAERQIDSLLDVFPGSAAMVLDTQMRAIAAASHANLSLGFLASTAALLRITSLAVIMGAEVNEGFVLRPYDEQRAKGAPPQDPVPDQIGDTPVDPNPPSPRPDSSSASTSM